MILSPTHRTPYWETLIRLGRISNLPTVWSNCLAGWWLGGGGSLGRFLILCLGATCLYLGGMFLNDAFDAEFDRLHRRERPIPAGLISLDAVWRWGFALLGSGTVLLVLLGNATGAFAALLLFCIVLYDAVHKLVAIAPILMALCRLFLVLTAGSVGTDGVSGLVVWSALALGFYVAGLSTLARHEKSKSSIPRWPALLLAVPVLLALLANSGNYRLLACLQAFVVGLWILRCLQPAMMTAELNVRRSVEGLLAGIVLVDLLALGGSAGLGLSAALILLFGLALALQRLTPAS
jgi:4-hydroxybenzoate polyprenyltransferase